MKPKKMPMKKAERMYEGSAKDKQEDRKGAKELIRKAREEKRKK